MAVTIVGNNTPTAGSVVYGDGTNYASTAVGTSGQLLQSNGSSAPSWATVASSPMVLITTTTASAASQVAFTDLSSTYVKYIIELTNVSSSVNNTNLYIRTSTNNGSSYDSGASNYVWISSLADQGTSGTFSGQVSTVATEIRVGVSISNVVNDGGINIQFNLINPSAATRTVMYWDGGYVNAGPNYVRVLGTGVRNSTAGVVNAVQLLPGSGTFTGIFKLYGVL